MTKQEFIEKATDYGYPEESIRQFVKIVEENDDVNYVDIFLFKHRTDRLEDL